MHRLNNGYRLRKISDIKGYLLHMKKMTSKEVIFLLTAQITNGILYMYHIEVQDVTKIWIVRIFVKRRHEWL